VSRPPGAPPPRRIEEAPPRHRRHDRWRVGRWALAAVVVVGVMLLFVLPGRTYLAQRQSLATTQARLNLLSRENAKLAQRAQQLQDPAQIEQIARADYGLVMPNQQAYTILPTRQGNDSFWARTGF
jgi:cell division protein FtsB